MTKAHYLLEWVVQEDQTQAFYDLYGNAEQFGCEIRLVSGVKTNDEGYYVENIVLDAPNQEILDQFLETTAFSRTISNWKSLPVEERANLETFSYKDPQFIGDNRAFAESIFARAYQNKELKALLENTEPLYFFCDWVVPTQLLANPQEAERVSWIDWNFKFASAVIFDIVTAAWQLGKGREVRRGKGFTSNEGLLGIRLIIRVFNKSELNQYFQSQRVKIFDRSDWKPAAEEDFLQSIHLEDKSLKEFFHLSEDKSQYNKKLMDKGSNVSS